MATKTKPKTPKKKPEAPAAEPTIETTLAELDTPASVMERRVTHTDTSLIFHPETTFEEWREAYAFYDRLHERGKWWLGDCIRFAEGKFPDRYTQAIEITGLSYSRLTTIVSVCGRIDPSRRRAELPFAFHEVVAYAPYQTGDHLLDRAIKEHWTRDQLADALAVASGQPTRAEKKQRKTSGTAARIAASGKSPEPAAESEVAAPIATTTPPPSDDEPEPAPSGKLRAPEIVDATKGKWFWNGWEIVSGEGKLFAPEELAENEAEACARSHGYQTATQFISALRFAGKVKTAMESTPEHAPAPQQQAPEPEGGPYNHQRAMNRVMGAIADLDASVAALDMEKVSVLDSKKLLKASIPFDGAIDQWQKILGQKPTKR